MPKRIQRKRIKGWRMPPNTVYIGRGSRWGNSYVVGKDGTPEECSRKYMEDLLPYSHHGPRSTLTDFHISVANLEEIELVLAGKNVACWCGPNDLCHGDELLKLANQPERKVSWKPE